MKKKKKMKQKKIFFFKKPPPKNTKCWTLFYLKKKKKKKDPCQTAVVDYISIADFSSIIWRNMKMAANNEQDHIDRVLR